MTRPARRLTDRVLIPAAIAIAACLLLATEVLWRVDAMFYDVVTRLSLAPVPEDIVIVAVDERSLAALGRWPWPRRLHAVVLDRLTTAGARAVAFDVAFPEASTPEDDGELAAAIQRNGRTVLPVLHEQAEPGGPPVETLPFGALAEAAAALAHVDIELDPDGIARTAYLKAGLGRPSWSFLPLAALEVAGDTLPTLAAERDPDGSGGAAYLWMRDERVLVPFVGRPGSIRRLSLVDVYEGTLPEARLANAYVLVGPTAPGIGDALPTPVSGASRPMPGVEYAANVLAALRAGTLRRHLDLAWTFVATALLVGLASSLMASVRRRTTVWASAVGVTFGLAAALLAARHLWFTPTAAFAGLTLGLVTATWRHRLLEAERLSRQRLRSETTLDSVGDAVIGVDETGRVEYLNVVAAAWLACRQSDVVGRELADVLPLLDATTGEWLPMANVDEMAGERDGVLQVAGHAPRPVRVSSTAVRDERGRHGGAIVLLAESRTGTAGAPVESPRDPLTQLSDRARIESRLGTAISKARRDDRWVGVLFLDLDRFRVINRGLGAKTGDQLLRSVAARLRTTVREADDVARVGGDEFVVLLNGMSRPEDAGTLSRRILDELKAPFPVEGVDVTIDASIGLSVFPRDGDDPDALLRQADLAVRWAKEYSHERIEFFDARMTAPSVDRLVIEQHLRGAIDREEIGVMYQPQLSIASGAIVGVEALVRWRHPRLGTVSPATFVPVAEETGLVVALGEWMLRKACGQLREWDGDGLPPLRLSVNVSPRQFLDPKLGATVASSLDAARLSPERLALEITEGALVRDDNQAATVMRAFKELGVEIALDDFGVGYSSLSYLKRFPIDRVKIDKSFVRDLATNHDDRTICAGVIAMAHSRQRRVTAEGVETSAQLSFLRAQQCDEVQGFLVSPPLEASVLAGLLRSGRGLPT